MNIFIESNDVIQIQLCICPSRAQQSVIYIAENKESLFKVNDTDYDIDQSEDYIVWFRYPNYSDSNNIMKNNIITDNGEFKVDIANIKGTKMSILLKDWTFKDKEGNKIPATSENLNKLHPIIGNYLSNQLDQII